jgi:hypothetical protein
MRDKVMRWGFGVSFLVHGVALGLFVPVVTPLTDPSIATRTIFLGAVLETRDITFSGRGAAANAVTVSTPAVAPTPRVEDILSVKPQWPSSRTSPVRRVVPTEEVSLTSPSLVREIVLRPGNSSTYLRDIDLKGLWVMAERREVIGNVDLRVLLNARGEVQEINKISGSGDPFFDLVLMGVLKKAVFDTSRVSGGYWLKVRFMVRPESGHVSD